jgi:hypothetical protein
VSNEYLFFDTAVRDRFLRFLAEQGIDGGVRADEIAGFIVETPDGLAEERQEAIEQEYDRLLDAQREAVDARDESPGHDRMGVSITLSDGQPCLVRIPGALGRRLCSVLTLEEIHDLVTTIARCVERPTAGPLCRDP